MSFRALGLVALLTIAAWPSNAAAQAAFGLGPRMSFIRGDLNTATPSARMFGGIIRLRTSRHVVLEGALDYRSRNAEDKLTRIRERPLQASLLLYPARSAFSPYLLGGYGIYQQTTDTLDATTARVVSTAIERRSGWHLGLGAELAFSRHAAFYADYRYRFVTFGEPAAGSEPINIPGSSLIPALKRIDLSHQGSMWTSGLAFYF